MPYHCVFKKCANHLGQLNKVHGITFHTFPSNKSSRQQWIEVVRSQRCEPDWTPSTYSRVCTLHFNPGYVFKTIKGEKRIVRGAVPYALIPRTEKKDHDEPVVSSALDIDEQNSQDEMNTTKTNNDNEDPEVIVVPTKMEESKDKVLAPDENSIDNLTENNIQSTLAIKTDQTNIIQDKPRDANPMPLDKFKRRLVRAVARKIQQKKSEEEMWEELKKEIGCDCKMLWQHMRDLTLKKLKRLLPANDFLVNLKKIARFTATDWLLFDLILVHEKVNVISLNDTSNSDETNKEEPQCLHDLFELVKEHKVEKLSGDVLTEAWIRVTLQYNSRGRQCSPMLLQLRWYQLKELTRARFYNFWCAYRGNSKILDRAMKFKPTILQTAIAREYKDIIINTYPEWEKLIEDRRVILSEEFTLILEAKRKAGDGREENDVEIELIEPQVETIELEVDSDEENVIDGEKKTNNDINSMLEEDKINSNNILNNTSTVKPESEDEVLELDGLSDVEAMHIPLKKLDEQQENFSKHSTVQISSASENDVLPKITNVVGSIIEPLEFPDEQQMVPDLENSSSDMEHMTAKTLIDNNQCTEIKDTDPMRCDSDDEMDSILREKANNLMNIEITEIKSECSSIKEISTAEKNIKTYEKEEEELYSRNDTLCTVNKLTLCDSDEDNDKLIQEKADDYLTFEIPKTNVDINEVSDEFESVIDTDNSNIHANRAIDEKDAIAKVKETIKKEKHDDGFDEVEFDNDQIEFVDDGIEFIEEIEGDKKKKNDLKIEPLSDFEEESITNIDLKLLMNPIVYTKKLDLMNIFKCVDFEFINDKNVIERATLESKPVYKLALKEEDINKFREQAIHGYETDGTQSDSDVVQTTTEYTNNRVKCTSWLLQKPKNRSYNPIQLCKNPDFNTRLKRLTAGFLSSTRNRVLLKECKPLTIDLHKSFESKLVNGTMYLKSGDFKSAKITVAEIKNNEPVSVLPSVIPGQSMIFTTNITNHISTVVPNKLENHEDNPPSTVVEKYTPIERRKTINLPDIDQVRRVNQSLLTAEVTPIRNNINNSCKEPVKDSGAEPDFVQPILFAPLAQIKNEPSELDLRDKNMIHPMNEMSSGRELINNKINDQIINLSNQISEVDNNDLLSIDVEKTAQKSLQKKNKLLKIKRNNVEKIKTAQQINKLTYMPRYRGKLTWSPKYPKNHIADSLLTLDTLSKILFLLNGDEEEIKKYSSKQKKCLRLMHNVHQNRKNDHHNYSQIKQKPNEDGVNQVQPALIKCNDTLKTSSVNDVCQAKKKDSIKKGALKKNMRKRRTPSEPNRYSGIYCCWAREKIINITKDKHLNVSKHGCHMYRCKCCCRHVLVKEATRKSSVLSDSKRSKNVCSTIVLSDDEEKNKITQNSKEIVRNSHTKSVDVAVTIGSNLENNPATSNALNAHPSSNNVAIEIVIPSLTPSTKVTISTDSVTTNVRSVAVQSEISQENISVKDSKVQVPSETENNTLQKQKSCKTIVHAAEVHAYKRLGEPNSNTDKEQNNSVDISSANSITDISKGIPKHIERTLFLNSSQISKKSVRTPIYLGKNKILLCSLKNTSVAATPINPYIPILPYGVHFVMLPNGELTLSIDNGTQLDSEQLSALPALMSMVQQQYLKSNISNQVPEHNSASQKNDEVSTMEESNETEQIVANSTESLNNPSEIQIPQDKSTDEDKLVNRDKDLLSDDKNVLNELTNSNLKDIDSDVSLTLNSENETTQINVQSEVVSTESACNEPINFEVTATETDKLTTELQLPVEIQINNNQIPEDLHPSAEPSFNDKNDFCENKNADTRKTLLSDLMEMSGISAEDTGMVSDVTKPSPPITTLPPTIIPVTRPSGNAVDMFNLPSNSSVPENISIMGPYSNLFTFQPTTPLNHLLNCIAQMKPELNAVTTFAELKYVYENDGRFYKLDVDTGIISEIKVFIKKNPKLPSSTIPKAFIDLTDDSCENEVTCAEFQDIPQENQGNAEVKPIKLFKAVHPAILKRSGRSILKGNEVVYPKKIIRINKERRKQLLNICNKYVLVEVNNKKKCKKAKDPLASQLDSSYDSSDEEPLAKKSKRFKPVEENVEETIPLVADAPKPNDSVAEKIVSTPDILDISGECDDTSDLEMNSMDIEGVNPELHPVAFEEGSESDEDNCILGV